MMLQSLKFLLPATGLALAFALPWNKEKTMGMSEIPTTEAYSGSLGNPVELGAIHWSRDLDSALALSKTVQKPVLILFQEVPGCSNCTRFGSSVLSHPLIAEAVESMFVPVCIYNNKKGKDAAALERFDEPAWNNPVVRIVDASGKDLTARMPDFRSQSEMVEGMQQALEKSGQEVPAYLKLLVDELSARDNGLDTATFSMYCFWSGEGTFGAIDGVIETEPGYQDGKEVVKVVYDPRKTSKTALDALTQPKGINVCSKNAGFRIDKEPKYYLSGTSWKSVPMTTLQACRANSLVGQGKSPEPVLSPRQIILSKKNSISAKPSAIGQKDLVKAWAIATGK